MAHVMGMLPGFVVGCIVIFAAWGIRTLIAGASRRKQDERNNGIVSSIESAWTDADSMIASFRSGQLTETAFKTGLTGKIETINRLYKSSLHQLDIFFVKYTEKLLEEYRQMIAGGATGAPVDRHAMEQPVDQTIFQAAPAAGDTTSLRDAPGQETGISALTPLPTTEGFEATVLEEAVLEPVNERGMESTIEAPVSEEEPVVAAMTEADNGDDQVVPIETFLDMDPNTSFAEEPVLIEQPGSDGSVTTLDEQPIPMSYDIQAETPEETQPQEVQPQETYDSAATRQETAVSDEAQFEMSTPEYAEREAQPVQPKYAGETMIDQPAFDYSAESAAASEATEAIEQTSRMPPSSLDRGPGYKRDESVEPATIFDIEAETIIADRNEIFGNKKPAKEEPSKSSLGITGDDISTQLDNFFNIK
jgi:hypothetical protein